MRFLFVFLMKMNSTFSLMSLVLKVFMVSLLWRVGRRSYPAFDKGSEICGFFFQKARAKDDFTQGFAKIISNVDECKI